MSGDPSGSERAGWSVYVLASRRVARTYVGISTDPSRRLAQHNGGEPGGARSTRAARPWRIARLLGPYPTRSEAQRVEAELKQLRGRARLTSPRGRPRAAGARAASRGTRDRRPRA